MTVTFHLLPKLEIKTNQLLCTSLQYFRTFQTHYILSMYACIIVPKVIFCNLFKEKNLFYVYFPLRCTFLICKANFPAK